MVILLLLSDVNIIPGNNVIKEDALKVGYFFSRNSGHTPAYQHTNINTWI